MLIIVQKYRQFHNDEHAEGGRVFSKFIFSDLCSGPRERHIMDWINQRADFINCAGDPGHDVSGVTRQPGAVMEDGWNESLRGPICVSKPAAGQVRT